MQAAVAAPDTYSSETELRQQLQEAYRISRKLRLTLMGLKADSAEALNPIRRATAVQDFKSGLQSAQEQLDELETVLGRE